MGQNKDAAIGFIGITVIIAIIVGAVMILLPEEPEEKPGFEKIREQEWIEYDKEFEAKKQAALDKQKQTELKEAIINDPLYDVVFDPVVVRQAEKSIPVIQNSFKVILDECNSIRSYSDYVVFATGITIASNEINQLTSDMDKTLAVLEILGYDEHYTVGPLIKETRQLGGEVGNCIIDVQNRYEK